MTIPAIGSTVWQIRWMCSTGPDSYYGREERGTLLDVRHAPTKSDPANRVALIEWETPHGKRVEPCELWLFDELAGPPRLRSVPYAEWPTESYIRIEAPDGTELRLVRCDMLTVGSDWWTPIWISGGKFRHAPMVAEHIDTVVDATLAAYERWKADMAERAAILEEQRRWLCGNAATSSRR